MGSPKSRVERRERVWRRQFNQSFMDEHGNVMIAKVIAVAAQIVVLYYTASLFPDMLSKPETLLICLGFLIAPDAVRKWLNLKYGASNGQSK